MTSTVSSPVISAPCGPLQGFQDGPIYRYTGIPYARGERFQTPVPVDPWTETFQATTPAAACPQPRDPFASEFLSTDLLEGIKVDEHCQELSVSTPSDMTVDEKLSVMVWFHGGAFVNGTGDAAIYNPIGLVSENRVVVVNVSSRLNVFGYLGDGSSRPANLGLLDVMESLRWVKKNIAAFGGNDDPRSITIFGQSAGGSTVSDIMTTDGASSLFGRVIIQSAPFGVTRGRAAMEKSLFEHVKHASPSMSNDDMIKLTQKVLQEGRKHGNMGGMPFAPQYGYAPLPSEAELEATLNACASQFDILIGATAEEGTMFVGFIPIVHTLTKLPLMGSFIRRTFVSWSTSMLYAKGAQSFSQRHVKAGGKSSYYTITWRSKDPMIGSMHAIELPLLFGKKEIWDGSAFLRGRTWDETEKSAKQLRKIWADFAKGRQVTKEDSVEGVIKIA